VGPGGDGAGATRRGAGGSRGGVAALAPVLEIALLELLAMIWAENGLRHNRSSRQDRRPALRAPAVWSARLLHELGDHLMASQMNALRSAHSGPSVSGRVSHALFGSSTLPGTFTRTAATAVPGREVNDLLPMMVSRSLLTSTRSSRARAAAPFEAAQEHGAASPVVSSSSSGSCMSSYGDR
jgi:hypothetical protein